MYPYQAIRFLSSRFFVYCLLQVLCSALFLNATSCSCNEETAPFMPVDIALPALKTVSMLNMTTPQRLLVGPATDVEVNFQIGGLSQNLTIDNFRLRVTVLEQKGVQGPIPESQVTYKDIQGNQQTFIDLMEVPFKDLIDFQAGNNLKSPSKFKLNFKLIPSPEAIQAKVHVELLDRTGSVSQQIEVEWIRSEMVIGPLTRLNDKEATFSLYNLKESISDLRKITVTIADLNHEAFFLVGENRKTEATLADLLPLTSVIAKDQATDPITIRIDHPEEEMEEITVFSILVLATNKLPIDEEKVEWSTPGLGSELEKLTEEIKNLEQKGKLSKEESAKLKAYQENLRKAARNTIDRLNKGKKQIEQKQKKALKELEEAEKQALIGKTPEEKIVIQAEYRKKQEEIKAATKDKLEYRAGVKNAIKHNLLGFSLQQAKTPRFREGQLAGHRISLIIGRTETAVGPTLIGVGVGSTIGAGLATGGIGAAATIPVALVGGGLLAHGIFVVERSQTNLDALRNR